MTTYVVLWQSEEATEWQVLERHTARSARAAIASAAKGRVDGDADRFVAIPERSWQPVTVSVETKTALKFS